MRNQTTKSHNAKSKILLITLCIFGLLFSYSCQCKNNVSDPNNIPPDNGMPGSSGTNTNTQVTPTYTASDILVADATSTTTPLSITFSNATATLQTVTVECVELLSKDNFKYEGDKLTLISDFEKVPETRAKLTVVFALVAQSTNETLTKTTETIEAQIVKSKSDAAKPYAFTDEIKKRLETYSIQTAKYFFIPSDNLYADNKLTITNTIRYKADDDDTFSPSEAGSSFMVAFNYYTENDNIWTNVELTATDDSQVGEDRTGACSFTFKFTLTDSYKAEYGIETFDFIIEATAKSSVPGSAAGKVGKWAEETAQAR